MNALVRGVSGDWQTPGIFTAMTGDPMTILAGNNRSDSGTRAAQFRTEFFNIFNRERSDHDSERCRIRLNQSLNDPHHPRPQLARFSGAAVFRSGSRMTNRAPPDPCSTQMSPP